MDGPTVFTTRGSAGSSGDYCALLGSAAIFLYLISFNPIDPDVWHEMALIRDSLSAGHLIRTNSYAYTPSLATVVHHEWGAGALAYFCFRLFGDAGMVLLKFSAACLTAYFCFRCAARRGAHPAMFCLLAPMAAYLAHLGFYNAVRAQAYTFAFTACLLWLLERDRAGDRKWMALWLSVFPFWVNLHGGFVVGIGLIVLHGIEEWFRSGVRRDLLILLAITAAETLINPYGASLHGYLSHALFMERPRIPEWRSVYDLGADWTLLFLAAVGVVLYIAASTGVRRMPGILILAACAAQAGLHRKMLPIFAVSWICLVPSLLSQTCAGRWLSSVMDRRSTAFAAAWIAVLLFCGAGALQHRFWESSMPNYPTSAAAHLRTSGFQGNLMTPFRQGAYMSWELYPAVKVSVDGRYEVAYPDAVVEDMFAFYEAEPGWERTLSRYSSDLALIPKSSPVAKVIGSSGWKQLYGDAHYLIFAPGRANDP